MPQLSVTGGRDVHTVPFPDGTPPAEVDVLIVGAGPVGLSAAIELSRRGVRVAVVDQARAATLVRAGAMGHTPRVVEHFRRWGLLQAVRDEWTFPPEWNRGIRLVTSLVGHELVPARAVTFTGAGRAEPATEEALRRPQSALQKVFLDDLGRRGVPVTGGWQLTALREDAAGIEAVLSESEAEADGDGRRAVRARYVLGADGGSSTVRRLAGIEREGEHATEKRYRLIVRTGDIAGRVGPAPSGTNIVFNAKASGFLAAVSNREWRVYAGPFALDHEPAEAELLEVARAAFGYEVDLEIASATTFYHATRIARSFRRGRVLLVGDAAHVRTPGGNLGEGFGDVVNLGWKLAAVLAGTAPEALLDSYDEERRPHNHRVADFALNRAQRSAATLAEIRAGGIPDDGDLSPRARQRRLEIGDRIARDRLDAAGVTFDERYDTSSVLWYEDGQLTSEASWRPDVYVDDPRPGHRAPNGVIDPYGDTLYDRAGDGFALLVLGPDRVVEAAFAAEAADRALPFTVVHLDDPAVRDLYGADNVLVRPDQHVAWRGAQLPVGGAGAVLDRVLGGRAATRPTSPDQGRSQTVYQHDYQAPAALRTRGTVLVVPGRGETAASYVRLGSRLAADAYRVRVLDPLDLDAVDLDASLDLLAGQLERAVAEIDPLTHPLVLLGADSGAAVLAALVARGTTSASWWPQALVLAGLPGYGAHETGDWAAELDARTHCPAHRGVLSDDAGLRRGALDEALPNTLLDAAYGSTVDLPHLLLVGDSDGYADRDALTRAGKALPTARLTVVRGAHHDVLNDLQHRSVAAEIVTFLEVLRGDGPPASILSVESSAW